MCTEIVLAGPSTFTAAFDSATYTLVSLISPEGQATVTVGCRSNADLFTITAYLDSMIREFPPCGKSWTNVSVSFGPATGQLLVELYSAGKLSYQV